MRKAKYAGIVIAIVAVYGLLLYMGYWRAYTNGYNQAIDDAIELIEADKVDWFENHSEIPEK